MFGVVLGVAALVVGRVHPEHRGFDPPEPDASWDLPAVLVLSTFLGMGGLRPLWLLARSLLS
ncbi:hypothetical protein PPSIR1_08087 [Plesiocystis pacifica SIR-1]|uniref:Uncharacterized protein n=1 Tax=Plesiocystis pacifica SIR-1 TaxID=391625 RepID=A6GG47_9BACT|nr:hypothetical protein PPSIR1_08087 [Plesiocystis pacifica SIR-1]